MKRDLIAYSPVANCETVVGVPQHGLTDAVVEREHSIFALDDRGARSPGNPIDRLFYHHVGRHDILVLSRAFEVYMAPEVEKIARCRGLVVSSKSSAVGIM